MDKPKTTAKDFFLWAGAMVAFYWSVIAFILLIFSYIGYAFQNALAYTPDPYQSGISFQMASVIVMLPIFMLLMKLVRRDIVKDPSRKEIWVRRWLLILTLFVAGIAMAADLITVLTTFLSGEELTTAFLLKVAVILLVAGAVFMHFIADLWGYWDQFPMRKRYVGIAVIALALLSIVSGFLIVGTPAQARLARYDAEKVSGLQDIQYRVTTYWQAKQKLPATLDALNDPLFYGNPLPTDPQTGASYVYQTTGTLAFKLCATFNGESWATSYTAESVPVAAPVGVKRIQDNWQHGSGEVCFNRAIDPSFYPPLTK
jgi:hypothetical protein